MKTTSKKLVNHDRVSGDVYEGEKFYFIWNPASPMPPTAMFEKFDVARKVALRLANENPGEEFFISQSVACALAPVKAKTTYLK